MDRVTAQSRAPVVGVARHFIRAFCSSYNGTPKNLPMSTKARTGHEELGYRGFKRRREHL